MPLCSFSKSSSSWNRDLNRTRMDLNYSNDDKLKVLFENNMRDLQDLKKQISTKTFCFCPDKKNNQSDCFADSSLSVSFKPQKAGLFKGWFQTKKVQKNVFYITEV